MAGKELCALCHSLAVLPWAPHLVESRVQFGADFGVFPRVCRTLLAPLLNQGLPKMQGAGWWEAVPPSFDTCSQFAFSPGWLQRSRCCPTHPNESVPRWVHV